MDDPTELEIQMIKKWKPTIGHLVWTQGVTIQQSIKASERMNEIYNPLYQASNAELNRIRNAAYFLNDNKLIADDVEKQVLQLAESLYDLRYEHFNSVKEVKVSEREQAQKEINDRVEEWRQQWKNE